MVNNEDNRVIFVEGLTDKKQIDKVLTEKVTIVCTHGTFSVERFDNLLEQYDLDNRDVYILVDEDKAGIELRNQLIRELPHAKHMHVSEGFKEVAATPEDTLAKLLNNNHFGVNSFYLSL